MNVRELIALHEGRVPWAYNDSLGYLTIGVGHLIDRRKGGHLPESIIDALLDKDIEEHQDGLRHVAPFYDLLDEVRRAVLLDMTFNLGVTGIAAWPMFLGQVRDHRFDVAAKNMRATKWATQVGSRAERLAKMMETGKWP